MELIDALLGPAESGLAYAKKIGADQCEIYGSIGRSIEAEIEDGKLSLASNVSDKGWSIRLIKDGKTGFTSTTKPDGINDAIDSAMQLASISKDTGFSLPEPAKIAGPREWDDEVAALDPQIAMDLASELIAGATMDGITIPGGGASLSVGAEVLVNSEGASLFDESTRVGGALSTVAEAGPVNTYESDSHYKLAIDCQEIGRKSATIALSLLNPIEPKATGPQNVVLSPEAGAELLAGFIGQAVNGDVAMRGSSIWSDSIGKMVAAETFSVIDDATRPDVIGKATFDGDGVAIRPTPIIKNGELQTHLFDAWDANRHGKQTTGHSIRGEGSRPSTGAHHLHFEHRNQKPMDQLLADIGDGYWVESLLGAHTANPTTGRFSVTAPNVWHIEDGQFGAPSKEIAIAGSVPKLLASIAGATTETKRMGSMTSRALWFEGLAVSC